MCHDRICLLFCHHLRAFVWRQIEPKIVQIMTNFSTQAMKNVDNIGQNLSQFTLFCRDLRAFVWRKIVPKFVFVEKKRQISGMEDTLYSFV